jgi:CheY-like chemotaxis protein
MSGEKPQALVVEDHKDVADLFRLSLVAAGYQVEVVNDGWEALNLLKTRVPNVVALDLQLPGVPGPEILHYIRSHERLAKTRVMLVTAEQHLAQDVEEEADLVLLKPVSFDQLRDLAARLKPQETS